MEWQIPRASKLELRITLRASLESLLAIKMYKKKDKESKGHTHRTGQKPTPKTPPQQPLSLALLWARMLSIGPEGSDLVDHRRAKSENDDEV